MKDLFEFFAPLQILFIPSFLAVGVYFFYRALWRDDRPAGLALYLALALIMDGYMRAGIAVPGFAQGTIKYSEIVWLLLYLKDVRQGRPAVRSGYIRSISLITALYFLLVTCSLFVTPNTYEALCWLRSIFLPQVCLYLLAAPGFKTEAEYRIFYVYLGAIVAVSFLFLLWLKFCNRTILWSPIIYDRSIAAGERHGSIFGNPNALGAFIVLLLPAYFMLISSRVKWRALTIIALLAFLLSQTASRGPIAGVFLSVAVLALLKWRKMVRIAPALLGLVIVALSLGFYTTLIRRFEAEGITKEFQMEELSRAHLWYASAQIILDYPLGIGLGEPRFVEVAYEQRYVNPALIYEFDSLGAPLYLDNPHNSLLQLGVMAGIHTLVSFLILFLRFVWVGIRHARYEKTGLLGASVASMFGFLFVLNVEPVLFNNMVALVFWTQFCLGVALAERTRSAPSPTGTRGEPCP